MLSLYVFESTRIVVSLLSKILNAIWKLKLITKLYYVSLSAYISKKIILCTWKYFLDFRKHFTLVEWKLTIFEFSLQYI